MKWKIDWWALYAEVVNIKNRQNAHIHRILVSVFLRSTHRAPKVCKVFKVYHSLILILGKQRTRTGREANLCESSPTPIQVW